MKDWATRALGLFVIGLFLAWASAGFVSELVGASRARGVDSAVAWQLDGGAE